MYHVINYNIGSGSRTIIAQQVNSSTNSENFFLLHLSKTEQENPLKAIKEFFESNYSLPTASIALEDMALKVAYDIPAQSWKREEEVIFFILQFSRLIEAAFMIKNESCPDFKVDKITKENMIPKHILSKSENLEAILPYLPNSQDPQDSKDPSLNLQILFFDTPIQELLDTFKAWGKCVSSGLKLDKTFQWNSHLDLKIFTAILEACHLIYVRGQKAEK
ncbi:hypothetical protein [Algoriphagus aquimarinus]|mgnify:CR=1 FL=1|uniref:hypothetical protein n=1 Tax=Algoriphagus aquimarinus TaxID=237018 RepID=UPI0030D8894B|tara:strand:- start:42772 stop:43431 length:660 start_codon:yes stop_codon:yes gene_type:complete